MDFMADVGPDPLDRWYPLKPHPVQMALVQDNVRFKVVPAGRRSGKTERAKRYLARAALSTPCHYFAAAPTRDQAKRIYWEDMKKLCFVDLFGRRRCVSESELMIRLPHGGSITIIGLDQPARIEGVPWEGGVVDEIASVKPDAWALNISPALDTIDPRRPDHRAWCWLIGVPEGLNHYYDLAEKARLGEDPDWKLYTWFSSEILPPDVIEAAKRRMSPKQFRQEYEASFETAAGRIYEDYGKGNWTDAEIRSGDQLLWCHDFNYSPLSSAVCVRRDDSLFVLDEIVLESAVARQSALEFVERYRKHGRKDVIIYGDPAGRAGEKHGHRSDYVELEGVLKDHGWKYQRRVKPKAPSIRDRQNAVRARICNYNGQRRLFVNPKRAEYMHKGLSVTQLKEGSSFLEQESRYQHITTALGYMVDCIWPVRTDDEMDSSSLVVPSVQNWGRFNVQKRAG